MRERERNSDLRKRRGHRLFIGRIGESEQQRYRDRFWRRADGSLLADRLS